MPILKNLSNKEWSEPIEVLEGDLLQPNGCVLLLRPAGADEAYLRLNPAQAHLFQRNATVVVRVDGYLSTPDVHLVRGL